MLQDLPGIFFGREPLCARLGEQRRALLVRKIDGQYHSVLSVYSSQNRDVRSLNDNWPSSRIVVEFLTQTVRAGADRIKACRRY